MIRLLDINAIAERYAGSLIKVVGVFRAAIPPNTTFRSHTQAFPTPSPGFVFGIRGSGIFIFDGTSYELQTGKVLHGGEGMSLTMRTEASELEYFLVRYTLHEAGQPDPSSAAVHKPFELDPGITPAMAELLNQLRESFYASGSLAAIRTGYLFQMLLHETLSSSLNRHNDDNREIIEQARNYIHSHYMQSLSVAALAERHGLSAKSFSYLFHKHTGVFPIDYLIQHRMKRAQELLTMSDAGIKQIAASVGYEDALYFSRLYKKHFGRAPSQARRI
ncbi:helix-turn-helix domain-containing protein [Cohnella sp. GCM10012308]|uniref:AraC family transcriptional regulator n=1 Tax=Cohnella sp. GCM10012308 TaxID=3317329 RepID=UPI003609EC9B